ncbi:MAG: cytochrome ubiquinol oxidase subunit I [Chromatiales bacterium]|nr:cytochrome ubiquinol oxidase subunit I [Chromatiales bacterium]MDH4029620.1 cytochrome ubiquinol oxidase subunit I [Chromatiales bacterium]
MTDLDMVLLARLQFAFTISFHIIFPAFTIGLASYLAMLEGLWLKTGREVYLQLYRFWVKIFAVSFGMGVVSGLVMSYQFGTNWSLFSEITGNVLGPLLGYEVLTAFFLEASFLGIMLFGWNRVGPRLHFISTLVVAIGTLFSAFWILAANSWMQTPAGYEIRDGIFHATDWIEVIFNPSFPYRFSHMVLGAYCTTGLVVGAVGAFHLLRGTNPEPARVMTHMALGFLAIVVPAQMIAGHEHGANVYEHQPVKLAAMEGHWETYDDNAPLVLIGFPNEQTESNDYALSMPKVGSLIVTGSFDGKIRGLKEWPASERPPVGWVFWSFRVMVGLGMIMLFVGLVGAVLVWRRKVEKQRWFLHLCVAAGPAGFIAVIAGWFTAEIGRQPYTVYGLLRTVDSVSPVTAGAVGTSLIVFIFAYSIVFAAGMYYILKLAQRGPEGPARPPSAKPDEPVLGVPLALGRDDSAEAAG